MHYQYLHENVQILKFQLHRSSVGTVQNYDNPHEHLAAVLQGQREFDKIVCHNKGETSQFSFEIQNRQN